MNDYLVADSAIRPLHARSAGLTTIRHLINIVVHAALECGPGTSACLTAG
jgi:hypothetical protein